MKDKEEKERTLDLYLRTLRRRIFTDLDVSVLINTHIGAIKADQVKLPVLGKILKYLENEANVLKSSVFRLIMESLRDTEAIMRLLDESNMTLEELDNELEAIKEHLEENDVILSEEKIQGLDKTELNLQILKEKGLLDVEEQPLPFLMDDITLSDTGGALILPKSKDSL